MSREKVKVKSIISLKDNDLKDRLFRFAVDVLKMLGTLKGGKETEVIKYQLSKSSTSSGTNYEESQATSSKADFINEGKYFFKRNARIKLLVKNY